MFDRAKAQPAPEAPTKNSNPGCSPTSHDEETIPGSPEWLRSKDAKVSYHNFIGAMVDFLLIFYNHLILSGTTYLCYMISSGWVDPTGAKNIGKVEAPTREPMPRPMPTPCRVTADCNSIIPDLQDVTIEKPKPGAIRISAAAVEGRLRRIFTPNVKGGLQGKPGNLGSMAV